MDEELMEMTTQDVIELPQEDVVSGNVEENDLSQNFEVKVTTDIANADDEEEIEIDVEEAAGWVGGDEGRHYNLVGRNDPDQHEIKSITGLREELESIKTLQTVYSDKFGVANYYKWNDGSRDETGYFVSLVSGTDTIAICDGGDIFGVTVDDAGFIGNQTETIVQRSDGAEPTHLFTIDNTYALVATTGLVDVRCESDVVAGDFVVSNLRGIASKTTSSSGYRVVAINDKQGTMYASVSLGVQANITDALGKDLDSLSRRVADDEKNIINAVNVANAAHNKASQSVTVSEEAIRKALEAIKKADGAIEKTEGTNETLLGAITVAAQAKAIAESAVTSAITLKDEAISKANDAWAKADKVETEAYSLCAKMDQYSVGEYSQAYGLTFEQAQNILTPGMIYAPTKHIESSSHTEVYEYTNNFQQVNQWDGTNKDISQIYYAQDSELYWYYKLDAWHSSKDIPVYTRSFVPEYLYQWSYIAEIQRYGWVTIDKSYKPTDESNGSAKAVYFTHKEPNIVAEDNFGYWYTDADDIEDKDGNVGIYESYTLYKWEVDHWLAVATLKGSVNNRVLSQVSQTTNDILLGVSNTRGCISALDVRITDTEAAVNSVVSWPKDEHEHYLATISQVASEDGSSLTLSAVTNDGVKTLNGATIVLGNNKDESFIALDADRINFDAKEFTVRDAALNVLLRAGNGQVNIGDFTVAKDDARSYLYSSKAEFNNEEEGVYLGTDGIGLGPDFYVKSNGYLRAKNGQIASFAINGDYLTGGKIGMCGESNNDETSYAFWAGDNTASKAAFSVTHGGYLKTTRGQIGGWDIDVINPEATLKYNGIFKRSIQNKGQEDEIEYTSGMAAIGDGSSVSFWAGAKGGTPWEMPGTWESNTAFYVREDGYLKSTYGKIGGFSIKDNVLTSTNVGMSSSSETDAYAFWAGNDDASKAKFSVKNNGFLSAQEGVIGGQYDAFYIKNGYNKRGIPTTYLMTASRGQFDNRDAYLGGPANLFGTTYQYTYLGTDGISCSVGNTNVFIRSGEAVFSRDSSSSNIPGRMMRCYSDGIAFYCYGSNKDASDITSFNDVKQAGYIEFYEDRVQMMGTWTMWNSSNAVTSDENLKNTIETLTDKYTTLFDSLTPVRFKYNDGTSGRFHVGFIAQDVKESIESAGLDTNDFAAYIETHSDSDEILRMLRYEEFIALNTMQIQKLKAEVSDLKTKILELEAR